ncbi:MAG: Ig-like domain-containing protein [Phaeodactylibacter sp.]|uniref:Ig-like domain-containing protein n=1 Tax=Phaeodactylibacter sp. TaxID=1940289 RepID=UPI0032EBE85B
MQITVLMRLLLLSAICFLLWQCANPGRPEGGPKDEIPPQLVPEKSSRNYQINYEKSPIELSFSEWVEIRDAFNQVIISPPLQYKYELSIKGKSIIFEFDEREELRENATYTINFGEAIQDITERNPAQDVRYVFSTGDYIDSLNVRGIVVDARTTKPIEGALFLLYENIADSVVRTERPFYFGRTDKDGQFIIRNVKAATFKGFALLDNNLNYLFDQAQEAIGFPDSLLVVSDSLQPSVAIRMFNEALPLRLTTGDDSQYGKVRIAFNQPRPEDVSITHENISQRKLIYEYQPDTAKIWYEITTSQPWQIYIQQDTVFYDTIDVRPRDREAFLATASLEFEGRGGASKQHPKEPLPLNFNHPILAYDTALIRLYEDTSRTLVQPVYSLDTNGQRTLLLDYKWKSGKPYALELMPEAITDIYSLKSDTIIQDISVDLLKNYGNLFLTVDSLSADSAYVIELMDGEKVVKTYKVAGQTTFKQELRYLRPATFTVRVTEDWNSNGRWDTGNYDAALQPELMYSRDLEQLRANWDLESVVILNQLQQQARQQRQPPRTTPELTAITTTVDSTAVDSLRNLENLPPSVRDRINNN